LISATQKEEIATQKSELTTQKPLNTTQNAILNYLKAHPTATRQEVAKALGNITEDGVKFNIGKLQQYGRLKREGGRKNGSWIVIDISDI
jgi:ATP-dependent DNA helicase RecG